MKTDINDEYAEFWDELMREADVSGEPQQACFFRMFGDAAAENGDCADLTYTPVRREGPTGYQIDGYALDADRGELHVAVCDYRPAPQIESLNQSHIETLFRRAERFFYAALNPEFVNRLEETSPAFEAAYPIHTHAQHIARVRFILFSNARLVARKKAVESKTHDGRSLTYNLLDFGRYADIRAARAGTESIEIDVRELHGAPLPCLPAHTGEGARYESYLAVVPGQLIADLYGLYGARLLEQNVRTFLQARTKVNQGIIKTVDACPEMFFAYNNGLTATASGIKLEEMENGVPGIARVENLQIVNGGQTTASILYARDRGKADLGEVFVQMKLTVVSPEEVEAVVPKISRYANTQNRISEVDFFSSHPFHVEMEKISRRLPAPQKPGAFSSTKWFYERARGQYRDAKAYGAPAAIKRFEAEFPKDQVIVKADLAKYVMTFECQPHVVSQGAQKCFLAFAEVVNSAWKRNSDQFNEGYFKECVAKAIVFRWTDQMVARSDWYRADRGYKANIVTYAVAWFVSHLARKKQYLDLQRVWGQQDLDEGVKEALAMIAARVAEVLKSPPPEIKNVSEYAKRQACWARVDATEIPLDMDFSGSVVDGGEVSERRKEAVAEKKIDNEIEIETKLVKNMERVGEMKALAEDRGFMSPAAASGLRKLSAGRLNFNAGEKAALAALMRRLEEEGLELHV